MHFTKERDNSGQKELSHLNWPHGELLLPFWLLLGLGLNPDYPAHSLIKVH